MPVEQSARDWWPDWWHCDRFNVTGWKYRGFMRRTEQVIGVVHDTPRTVSNCAKLNQTASHCAVVNNA